METQKLAIVRNRCSSAVFIRRTELRIVGRFFFQDIRQIQISTVLPACCQSPFIFVGFHNYVGKITGGDHDVKLIIFLSYYRGSKFYLNACEFLSMPINLKVVQRRYQRGQKCINRHPDFNGLFIVVRISRIIRRNFRLIKVPQITVV